MKTHAAFLAMVVILVSGCTTHFMNKSESLPTGARVAFVLSDSDGTFGGYAVHQGFVFNALLAHGLVPVSLNTADSTALLSGVSKSVFKFEGQDPLSVTIPKHLETLKPRFEAMGISHLLVLHVAADALDESLRGVLIRVEDMAIVASKYYSHDIMVPLCVSTFFISWLYCPLIYWGTFDAETSYDLVSSMLEEFLAPVLR